MSNKKTRKNVKRKKIMSTIFKIVMCVCVLAWFVVTYAKLDGLNKKYKEELQELNKEKEEKRRELNVKKTEINYYQSDENIEKIAREEVGLVKPNELVFIKNE